MNNIALEPKQSQFLRISVGLVFGLILAFLITGSEKIPHNIIQIWRPTLIAIFALSAFVFLAGLGNMRRISLLAWGAIAMLLIGIISHHAFSHSTRHSDFGEQNIFWILPFLFITHELVSSGDEANKIIAPYETYFDETWKRGVQLFLAIAFTGVFWAILWLGAALLKIIGLDWFEELLKERYFAIPATFVAFASAVHLGDVQSKLLNNFRNLVLSVFSWLLPIIVLVAGIFSVSLIFTGLKPLWETKAATASLLAGCMFLVLLINAAYQNGDNELNPILKWSIRIASFETLVFAAIAGYSLYLRIDQYGLTHERILALIGVIVANLYGVGYVASNFIGNTSYNFMPEIKNINIGMAFVKSILFFAILTPIADPSRLSVNSQVSMLLKGKTSPEKFDFRFLARQSGKYGEEALNKLTKNQNPQIVLLANKAIEENKNYDNYDAPEQKNLKSAEKIDPNNFNLIKGAKLPDSFVAQDIKNRTIILPNCMAYEKPEKKCDTILIDLNNDKKDEIIIDGGSYLILFYDTKDGWKSQSLYLSDSNIGLQNFKLGKVEAAKPEWNSLKVGDEILDIQTPN
ncbi:MAG: DUF4153 domain-containing protein [Caulobacterales bacterium]|nr:DUF4153 domain-containing protein [Caulobacterales bacterium]MCA0372395.1 DUF4153 domain-containing protein [Pseudomonadota bacterium]